MKPDPMIGRRLGSYRLIQEIGRGGMGAVYKATHESLNKTVAVKVLLPKLAGDEEFVKRFLREARAAAALDHPNVVPVYDVGTAAGTYFFAMRYVAGTTLETLIEKRGRLDQRTVLSLVRQLTGALAYAHRVGVVHRDLKPGNVIVDSRLRVHLSDFGIACASFESRITRSGEMFGSPRYMSPEQIQGETVDERSDLYSLGVVLYQMLTGELPFDGKTAATLAYQHLHEPVPSARRSSPDIPPHLDGVVQRLLAKRPEDRYPNAGALLRDLHLEGGVEREQGLPGARPEPSREKPPGRGQNRAALVVGLLLCLLGLGIVGGLYAWFRLESESGAARQRGGGEPQPIPQPADPPSAPPPAATEPAEPGLERPLPAPPAASGSATAAYGATTPPPPATARAAATRPPTAGTPPPPRVEPPPARRSVAPPPPMAAAAQPAATPVPAPGPVGSSPAVEPERPEGRQPEELARELRGAVEPSAASVSERAVSGAQGVVPMAESVAAPVEPPAAPPPAAAPVEPRSQPPPRESFTISTSPGGATVLLDGEPVAGSTPLVVELDAHRSHRLLVSLEGHEPADLAFALADLSSAQRSSRRLHFQLAVRPAPGLLVVQTGYPVAVRISEQEHHVFRRLEIPLEAGIHEVHLEGLEVYYEAQETISVASGGRERIDVPKAISVRVGAFPGNGTVQIDGREAAALPLTVRMALGPHRFEFFWEDRGLSTLVKEYIRAGTTRVFASAPEE